MGGDERIHGQHPADSVGQAFRGTSTFKGHDVVLEPLYTAVHYGREVEHAAAARVAVGAVEPGVYNSGLN